MHPAAGGTGETPARLRQRPTWLLNRAHGLSYKLLTEGFAAVGTHGYHYRLLAALAEFGPSSQADLARGTGVDRSDVVAALNEMADQGLVKRATDASDRRRNTVSITAAGHRRLAALDDVLDGIQDRLLAALSPEERQQLVKLLDRVLESHKG
jgi:DNA-binding MarR family transcriptional regulator